MSAVGESGFFIGAAVIVFLFAIVGEISFTRHYQAECKVTQDGIKFLKDNKGRADLTLVEGSKKLDRQVGDWIKDHLAGSEDFTGIDRTGIQDDRFVFLKPPNILIRSVPRSSLHFVPALLTAIGLLGTFYGIQTGLAKFDLSAIADSKKLLDASMQVLGGMKIAFTSSLVGLGCASVFMLVLAWGDSARKKHRDYLRRELDKIAILPRAEDSNQRAAQALSEAATTMRGLTPQAIGQEVGEALKPIFQQIQKELSTLREIKADQGQEVLKKLIENLRSDVLQPIVERLDQSAELTQGASQAVINLQAELGGISQSLAASILTIQHFQQETLGRLEGFAGGLKETLGQFQTETQTVLREVSQEIKKGVDQSIVGMEAQRTAFTESAQNAADTFRGIRSDLQAALHTQAQVESQMLEEVQNRTVEIFTAANTTFQQQAHTLQAVGTEASQLMQTAKAELVVGLQDINTMLHHTHHTTQQELEHFRQNYQASLQEFFTQQNNLLESTLGEQRQGLAQVVENLQIAFQKEAMKRQELAKGLDHSMTKVQETVQDVSNLANAVGLNSGARLAQIQEVSYEMGQQVLGLKSGYENLANHFNQSLQHLANHFNQSLQQGNEQLVGYLHTAAESEKQFFTQADEATAKLCNSLLQAASYLVAAEDNRRHESGDS